MSWKAQKETKKRTIKLYNKTKTKLIGAWHDDESNRYYRFYISTGKHSRTKFYKNYSNRLVRRRKMSENVSGHNYRKEFDLWRTLL